MEVHVEDIITRYEEELRVMTRRAILAEAELIAFKKENNGDTVGE